MAKQSNLGRNLGACLLLGLFLVYIGYQLVQNLANLLETEDALIIDVEQTVTAEGVFLRSQQTVTAAQTQTPYYLVEDGEKVSKGQALAIFFETTAAADAYYAMIDVQNQIDSLSYAHRNLGNGMDSVKMDELIELQTVSLLDTQQQGNVSWIDREYQTLAQLIVGRNSVAADQQSYTVQIEQLKQQQTEYEAQIQAHSSVVNAPASGYFFSQADGYEQSLHTDQIDALTPEYIQNPVQDTAVFSSGVIGVLVDAYSWYYAAVLDEGEADMLKQRRSTELYFPQISMSPIPMDVVSIETFDDGQVVALFETTEMDPNYLSGRTMMSEIVQASYQGIKVPKEALHQDETGQWGVYCLVGAVSQFKPVSWIYQTDSYYLVEPADTAKEGLYLYDRMIVNGKDLEDNKVVS